MNQSEPKQTKTNIELDNRGAMEGDKWDTPPPEAGKSEVRSSPRRVFDPKSEWVAAR